MVLAAKAPAMCMLDSSKHPGKGPALRLSTRSSCAHCNSLEHAVLVAQLLTLLLLERPGVRIALVALRRDELEGLRLGGLGEATDRGREVGHTEGLAEGPAGSQQGRAEAHRQGSRAA